MVMVQLHLKIPTGCCQENVGKSLKENLEDAFRLAPWFHVVLEGFRTDSWNLSARIDLGAPIMQLSLRDKFRRPVLQTFRDHLSATEYESFSKDFNSRHAQRLVCPTLARARLSHSWARGSSDPLGHEAVSAPGYCGSGRLSKAMLCQPLLCASQLASVISPRRACCAISRRRLGPRRSHG